MPRPAPIAAFEQAKIRSTAALLAAYNAIEALGVDRLSFRVTGTKARQRDYK